MKGPSKRRAGRPAMELIENATHLLRTAPAGALLAYYVGSVPCILGLLYFWGDMIRGAFAHSHLIQASLSAALLFLWMKIWHTVFMVKLRAHLMLQPEGPWTATRVARIALIQVAVQPWGLFLRLIAAQIIVPYIWTYGFFQSVGLLGDGTHRTFREVISESSRQAGLWLWTAHRAFGAIFLFTLFVWLNVCVAFGMAPMLLKTFFGVETVFSRNLLTMLNSTTFAATIAATYLCIDPFRKALVVLRCFHGSSLQSGEDLRVELRSLRTPAPSAAVLSLLLGAWLVVSPCTPAQAEETPAAPPATQVESSDLNDSVDRVLKRREYAWRLPLPDNPDEAANQGVVASFFDQIWKQVTQVYKAVNRWIDSVEDWLRHLFNREHKHREPRDVGNFNWAGAARITLWLLIIALVVIVGLLILRWSRGRINEPETAVAETAVPDLTQEDVTADQLPEDGWLRLANELIERGDLRLAVRAYYLAGLAHLGERKLINIARYKSDRDYDRELRRRARGNDGLLSAFDANLVTFEASWYGDHPVSRDTLGGFSENLEKIRAC